MRALLLRRHPIPVASLRPVGGRSPGAIPVMVAPTLVDRLPGLEAELGPGFAVDAGVPSADAIAVLRAAMPPTVAFWRARHPGSWLLVVDPEAQSDAVASLNAGADAYVAGPVTTPEAAAIVRSLARRRRAARLPA
jgi:DNA-binding NarL/FixJ family response regulator